MSRDRQTRWWRRLHALAELAGDSQQKDIAETVGVSAAAVTGWKKGTPPSIENVIAAARAYGVDPLDLVRIAFLEDEESAPKAPAPRGRRRSKIELSPRDDIPGLDRH
jgi:transcriptional regulator with XRE-family HTH domain